MVHTKTRPDDPFDIASNCRHYAMCKIDFLGTGVCASGLENHYVSFYPEGRMDLYAALVKGAVPVTEKCIEISASCDLCGKCDYQCSFVTGMRPTRVMSALRSFISDHCSAGKPIEGPPRDPVLKEIQDIVGERWAENDRAIAVTYATDPSPIAEPALPRFVIMPENREEISAIVRVLAKADVPWVVRASGTNLMGLELTSGAVIDLGRMKVMEFDEPSWSVRIGPGVSAFELQREAVKRGYRVNVAEPAALVCGSMMCMGIVSLFSTVYGASADNYINAEFVRKDGSFFTLNDKDAPNLFSYNRAGAESPGICSSLQVKIHPVINDESGALVPFGTLAQAVDFSKNCAVRRIGLAIGILGNEYLSSFMSPSLTLSLQMKDVLSKKLGMNYAVVVLGDSYSMENIKTMGNPVIDQELFRILSLGLPRLASAGWLDLIEDLSDNEPFAYLDSHGFKDLASTALSPSPSLIASSFDPDLRDTYEEVFSRDDLTDLVWLNMFRVTSSRIGRERSFFPFLMYLPLSYEDIEEVRCGLEEIARASDLKNTFGFVTPVDAGKRCILEYDYFYDQTDIGEKARIITAATEAGSFLDTISARTGTLRWVKYIFQQGFCRKDNLLYA
ncbi:MAG: iron-sulfur cluster-binding FAD-binding oxidoreductase [Deltaproteobacteria bacterium]|nr:iron-sulfur cluster-binding FAD-binding oxidoreductase [Deltaproteobacteria bacterium]